MGLLGQLGSQASSSTKAFVFVVVVAASGVLAEEAKDGAGTADLGVATMLLGCVSFMMGTFYLINSPDPDIKKASWEVISSTISIFCAVLLFQGFNGLVEKYVLGQVEGNEKLELLVDFLHAFVWFTIMQAMLAGISGAVTLDELGCGSKKQEEESPLESVLDDLEEAADDEEEEEEEDTDSPEYLQKQIQMKCWATLCGHITGFACINAFATLQIYVMMKTNGEIEATTNNIWRAVGILPLAMVVLTIFFRGTAWLRAWVSLADGTPPDQYEELWDDETKETEDDVMGLACSWVVAQALRFWITKVLPNAEGEVEAEQAKDASGNSIYSYHRAGALIASGSLLYLLHVIRTLAFKGHFISERLTEQVKVICGMVFSWCFFFGIGWILQLAIEQWLHLAPGEGTNTIWAAALAVTISFCSYMGIFALDALADAEFTPPRIDACIRELMKAMGILIGFSWEKSFDAAVESVCTRLEEQMKIPDVLSKLFLSIFLCALVIPAWRDFFLPQLQELGVWKEEEEEEEEAEEDMGHDICLLRWCPFLKSCYSKTAIEIQEIEDKAKEEQEKALKEELLAKAPSRAGMSAEKFEKIQDGHKQRTALVESLKTKARTHSKQAQNVKDRLEKLVSELRDVKNSLKPLSAR